MPPLVLLTFVHHLQVPQEILDSQMTHTSHGNQRCWHRLICLESSTGICLESSSILQTKYSECLTSQKRLQFPQAILRNKNGPCSRILQTSLFLPTLCLLPKICLWGNRFSSEDTQPEFPYLPSLDPWIKRSFLLPFGHNAYLHHHSPLALQGYLFLLRRLL